MKNIESRQLTITFDTTDLKFIRDCADALAKMHPEEHWPDERVVYLALGTLWRTLARSKEVTPSEFTASSIDMPEPRDIVRTKSLLDLLNKRVLDKD